VFSTAEAAGYLASALVFLTFYTKTMLPLRHLAIASNVAFIIYATFAQIHPVLLHSILLPLNLFRLWQRHRLIADVADAAQDLSIESHGPGRHAEGHGCCAPVIFPGASAPDCPYCDGYPN
jgi:hypothetical protein